MKSIGAFSLAIFIFVLSVFSVIPVYADDDKTVLPCNLKQTMAFSSSDAQAYVAAHKDIYSQDGYLLFAYTPAASYNWNLCKDGKLTSIHMSDKQVANYIMTDRPFMSMYTVLSSLLANNNAFRGFCSGLGAVFTKDSDAGTKILDTLTGNYNYLDSLNYDEDSQTITMSNDNGSVDKLREEIKNYYYDSLGLVYVKPTDATHNPGYLVELNHSYYEYEEDYISDFNALNQYDYSVGTVYGSYNTRLIAGFDKSSYSYVYMGELGSTNYSCMYFVDKDMNVVNNSVFKVFLAKNYTDDSDIDYSYLSVDTSSYYLDSTILKLHLYNKDSSDSYKETSFYNGYTHKASRFYSKNGMSFLYFKSYSALYNYLHGDQDAYLSSRIDKAGEDISYSIKDMDENLGSKMDTLIDSINDKKGSLSSDELQDAIDKGIENLTKNTEDIKDNTSSILDKLEEQNQILLQILGVTEYIAYQTTKDDGSSYTKTDLTNTINKIYNGLGNAILYGKNTLTDSGDSSGAASQSYIVTREDFKLSNNIYTFSGSGVSPGTPVVSYSLDDYSVYDDSNDYDVGIATQDINNMDIHDGLFGKFPFSVPYQLYEWLQVLQADPVAPVFNYNYGFLIGKKNDPDCNLRIDLSIYEPWSDLAKSFQRLGFTLLMALFIYNKFKGNSII